MITSSSTESSPLEANYNFAYVWRISSVAAMGGLLFAWLRTVLRRDPNHALAADLIKES